MFTKQYLENSNTFKKGDLTSNRTIKTRDTNNTNLGVAQFGATSNNLHEYFNVELEVPNLARPGTSQGATVHRIRNMNRALESDNSRQAPHHSYLVSNFISNQNNATGNHLGNTRQRVLS